MSLSYDLGFIHRKQHVTDVALLERVKLAKRVRVVTAALVSLDSILAT